MKKPILLLFSSLSPPFLYVVHRNTWVKKKTKTGKNFNKNSLHRILTNRKYIGIYEYNGFKTENAIPQLIDNKIFDKVQERLAVNKVAPSRQRAKTSYLLTTKLYCGYCKEMMIGYSGTSKTGRLYNYYVCKNAKLKLCNKKKEKVNE